MHYSEISDPGKEMVKIEMNKALNENGKFYKIL